MKSRRQTFGGRSTVGILAWLAAASLGAAPPVQAQNDGPAHAPGATPVRVAYTASIFRDIAENDAKAAIKAWAVTLAKEIKVDAYAEVEVVPDAETLVRLLSSGCADLGGTTTAEFIQIEERLDLDPIFAVIQGDQPTEEYLILVRRNSPNQALGDLRGATLRVYDNPRCSLAAPWLELLLAEKQLGVPTSFFGRVETSAKLSGVVLPVFFGQADACLVTRRGFQTMTELNPQLEKELRILVSSPAVIPMVSFFRRDYTPPYRAALIDAMVNLHASPTGRQILNLMQGDGSMILPPTGLDPARDLVRRWRQATGRAMAASTPKERRTGLAEGSAQ